MRESDFLAQLYLLLDTDVLGLNQHQKYELIQTLCADARRRGPEQRPGCRIVPFVTGRRPIDEAAHPGLGSSDSTSMILDQADAEANTCYILYRITGLDQYSPEERDAFAIDISLAFAGTDGSQHTLPLPVWSRRPIAPMVFQVSAGGKPMLRAIALRDLAGENLVVALSPNQDFLPGRHWRWDDLDAQVRAGATDACDPFTFGHLFSQMLHVSLRLTHHGVPVAASSSMIDICDTRRVGSLYQRIVERLIKPDAARQAQAAGVPALDHAYHPWFPVLLIGSDKATLYTEALVADIVHKQRHLTDPRWLMRVGLYLELLTCLGIFEAVKEDLGDVLTPAERAIFEQSPVFAEIRRRLDPKAWRKVWALRKIMFPKFGVPQTGPVSASNLLQKKKATLAFLKAHHEDLKHALELAGTNEHNAQETWHRVFRDAERAVLHKTPQAFPELAFLDRALKDLILWHQQGKLGLLGTEWLAKQLSGFFGDQDGLFAAACNQYRASMNDVAAWAKQRGIIDYTGKECIPEQVSLLHAYMGGKEAQLERLQHRDGYTATLDIATKLPDAYMASAEQVATLLGEAALFTILTAEERQHLATTARKIALGPMERIIIEGRPGSSMFVVAEGRLEVLVRQSDGIDKLIDSKQRGDVIGEISLLTGARRTATVRAIDGAIVYEIGKQQYEPIVKARPALADELALLMEKHLRNIHEQRAAYDSEKEVLVLRRRIRRFFLGG